MFGFIDFQLKCSISLYHGQRQPSTMGRRQFCDCHQQQSLVFLSHITVPCRALSGNVIVILPCFPGAQAQTRPWLWLFFVLITKHTEFSITNLFF